VKTLLKKMMYWVSPRAATAFFSARSRAHSHRVVKAWDSDRLNQAIISRFGRQVLSGPFKGMVLTEQTEKEFLGPYLLGTFESEIQPWLEAVCSRTDFAAFVDVGAKFGFYSVGFALRNPKIPSIAFDTDHWARQAMRQMGTENRCNNLTIRGYCDRNWIEVGLPANSFVLSDCEGYESVLFHEVCPSLKSATLLIETHDHEAPNITSILRERFSKTHHVEQVESGKPRVSPVDISFLTEKEQEKIVYEVREKQSWLLLTPR
jgi:hypothetical protein